MIPVRYVGPLFELRWQTAIAQLDPFRVQFDGNQDWRVPPEHKLKHPETGALLCTNWHYFPSDHFERIT